MTADHPMGNGLPLDGIRVIDFTQVEFGPCGTQVLADFGAEVIKIEAPRGDHSRHLDPDADSIDDSSYYQSLNRNKSSIVLDLKDPAGNATVRELIRSADLVVHNARPGAMERLGLGYEQLSQEHPSLIYVSGSGFGQTGPWADRKGQDFLAQSLSGAAHLNMGDDGRPRLYPIAIADYTAGMILAQGALLAIVERARSGQGQLVTVNLFDAMVAMQLQELTLYRRRGRVANTLKDFLVGVFQTSDGFVTIAGFFRPDPLSAIGEALELDADDMARLRELEVSGRGNAELLSELDAACRRFPTQTLVDRLVERDVLVAPVLDYDGLLAHPQFRENGMAIEVTSGGRPVPTIGNAIRMSRTPYRASAGAPALGADRP
ncbi:CaiB/BaiF CoA transferase family protein [Microbacterium sp. CPCC 204701]|uniref:CaiB/BaiF CoA transferase family protein n=1 Tax=Microbacterium sp. CPCC 204701 TaxID=2493084 RepID=UPI000FDBBC2B|nr:CoA transferase [Microbacterium sp. CPCC 204701]